MQKTLYIGLDVHKASISVATAEDGRDGATRDLARCAALERESRAIIEELAALTAGGLRQAMAERRA